MKLKDSSSATTDVPPKRLGKGLRNKRRYFHLLSVVLPLIAINVGVLSMVGNQLSIRADAEITQVKDASDTLPTAENAVTDNTKETGISERETSVVTEVTTYTVLSGDTLSGIADKFNISINTIRWANDLTSKSTIKPGDELVILPVTGIEYTVKKGDTLSGIAVKFDVGQDDILNYNDIAANAIKIGTELIIPGAEPLAPVVKAPVKKVVTTTTSSAKTVETKVVTPSTVKTETKESNDSDDDTDATTPTPIKIKFTNPIPEGVLTQRIHDGNAVDFGAPIGTPVFAAAGGKVLVAKGSGYNGGYGNFIVINHPDGSQTQYSHLSKVSVAIGDTVSQGEQIGLSGNSGRSTGPHLHYNERNTGKKNTFATLPLH